MFCAHVDRNIMFCAHVDRNIMFCIYNYHPENIFIYEVNGLMRIYVSCESEIKVIYKLNI